MATASSESPVAAGARWLAGWFARSWLFLAFFALFFVAWEVLVDLLEVPRYILPKPSTIVIKSSVDLDRLIYYTWITGTETVLGYAAAIVLAVPLGLAIAFSSFLRRTIYPFFVSIEMTPKIAFAPLFISWLGFGLLPKVIIVFLVCFFPIVLNAILAFGSLSEELTRFCRATGASAWRSFLKVRLPAAMPQCFVGFKYAAINATVGSDNRGVHRQRPGARLLHPDRDRQHASGPRIRGNLLSHLPRPLSIRPRHPHRAPAHSIGTSPCGGSPDGRPNTPVGERFGIRTAGLEWRPVRSKSPSSSGRSSDRTVRCGEPARVRRRRARRRRNAGGQGGRGCRRPRRGRSLRPHDPRARAARRLRRGDRNRRNGSGRRAGRHRIARRVRVLGRTATLRDLAHRARRCGMPANGRTRSVSAP